MMRAFAFIGALAAALLGCQSSGSAGGGDTNDQDDGACPWDENDEPGSADALTLGAPAEGYICPKADLDWYSLTVPSGTDIVKVSLQLDAPISPIDPTYALWDSSGENVVAKPATDEAAEAGVPLSVWHGIAPGEYRVSVRDHSDDAQDVRHPYTLLVEGASDPDRHEPNNEGSAAAGGSPGTYEGYISYRGDEDWYAVSPGAQGLVRISLTMPAGGIEPAFRVVSGEGQELYSESNGAGKREATSLSRLQSVSGSQSVFVVVSDDDGMDADTQTPYELVLDTREDPDSNEPNDTPHVATSLGSLSCSGSWSETLTAQGYLGSSGDVDWFKVDLSGCSGSIIESSVAFMDPGSLPDKLQASTRFVRSTGMECSADQDCTVLTRSCQQDIDCGDVGNTCLPEMRCAGAGWCLPGGTCAANLLAEAVPEFLVDPDDPGNKAPNPDRGNLEASAPLFGRDVIYIAVEDFHNDTYSLDHTYQLTVRVRKDPDPNEAFDGYTASPPMSDAYSMEVYTDGAVEVPVHDCTAGDCCGSGDWMTGYISYAYDQDFFKYRHPCPGSDCLLSVKYELDGGPVDFHYQIFKKHRLWFDALTGTFEEVNHSATSGAYGGTGADDECFYAFQGHEGDPYWYYLGIRDTTYIDGGASDGGTWDWSPDQAYRFCVEKIANGCQSPCKQETDGCTTP